MAFITWYHSSNTAFLPPTITDRVPSMALGSPPLTGASSISTSFLANSPQISRLTSGEMELISRTASPGLAPSMIPDGPSTTSFTWGELGSMVIMASTCSAMLLGVAPTVAPAAVTSSSAA
ncbi:hypothetical protein D3C76_1398620 [compost metagenome]